MVIWQSRRVYHNHQNTYQGISSCYHLGFQICEEIVIVYWRNFIMSGTARCADSWKLFRKIMNEKSVYIKYMKILSNCCAMHASPLSPGVNCQKDHLSLTVNPRTYYSWNHII